MSSNKELVTTTASEGTAAEWTAENPVLESGEWGKETDTGKMKNGDGVTAWNSLSYSAIPDIETIVDSKISNTSNQIIKKWIGFDGTGTGTIKTSVGFSGMVKNSTGNYTLNFTDPMPDTNYGSLIGVGTNSDYGGYVIEKNVNYIIVGGTLNNTAGSPREIDDFTVAII